MQEFAKLLNEDEYLETYCTTKYHKGAVLSSNRFFKNYLELNK